MRRAYIVTGELENDVVVIYYGICHSMERADALCAEAEAEDPNHYYTWHEVIEEDDE